MDILFFEISMFSYTSIHIRCLYKCIIIIIVEMHDVDGGEYKNS